MDNMAQDYLELTVIQLELGTGVIARRRGHFYRFLIVMFSDEICGLIKKEHFNLDDRLISNNMI
jgi:hypothetical protein